MIFMATYSGAAIVLKAYFPMQSDLQMNIYMYLLRARHKLYGDIEKTPLCGLPLRRACMCVLFTLW